MEIVFIIGLLVLGGVVYYFNKDKGLDVNNDGKVDVADIKEAVDNAKAGVKAEIKKLPTLAKLKAQTKAQPKAQRATRPAKWPALARRLACPQTLGS